jgi:glycosyltransferase involved in cell wall biosynthesis
VPFTFLSTCPEPWGGSEELWWSAACELRDQGHRVEVLKSNVESDHPRVGRLREIGCRVRDLDRGLAAPLDRRRRQMLVAATTLVARRPKLAVVCQGRNLDGAHLALLCGWLRIPYVVVSQKATEAQWPADAARPYLVRAFRRARRSVFVSTHNRWLTEQQIGAAIEHAVVLPNPVLAGRDGPLPWPSQNGDLRLACVGRLFPSEKGQDILLNVLARERWRERPLHVSFYGEGVNRKGLEWLAGHLGIESVSFDGFSDDIEGIWRSHHALVLPSRAEGLPLTLLEAMSCGRVPIVTDVGGSAEVVEDAATGFVAPSATVDALDNALERAWEVRGDWPAIGEAASRRIAELVPEEPTSPLAALLLAEARGA